MSFDVATRSPAISALAETWPMIDALVGGTAAMRKAGRTFLPQWPKEDGSSYAARLATAILFPAFSRTAQVLAAKPFSRPMALGPVPGRIAALLEDIDGQGTPLHAFAADILLGCLHYGLFGVLVDHTPAGGARTLAEERDLGARPAFAAYPAAAILGWRQEGGCLTQLRLMETIGEPDGEFGETASRQVRVLTPDGWSLWRENPTEDGPTRWVEHDRGVSTLGRIPFVFFYGQKRGYGLGLSPLLDLAFLNIEHWQSLSDQQTLLHTARVPILFGTGFAPEDELAVGAAAAIIAGSDKADLRYVEHSGAAIAAGRQSLLDLEDRMRQTGAELLVQRPALVTATQTVADGEGSRSILQRIAEGFESSLEACLALLGEWLGEPFAPKVSLFKEFGPGHLSDHAADLLLRAAEAGHVSSQTVFDQLQRRDILAPDLSWAEERSRLSAHRLSPATERTEP
jgi:hypothetical protein